jgi:TrmH family RNA methyltransferase
MRVKEITSRSNPAFKRFLTLLSGHGIKKAGVTFISGPKQVREVLNEFPDRCEGIILRDQQEVPETGISAEILIYRLNAELFREIDVFGTHQPILLIRCEPLPIWDRKDQPPGCSLFIPLIRSAAAFGVSRVIFLKEAAHPFHYKSARVAGSALLRVPMLAGPPIKELSRSTTPIITLSTKGHPIDSFRFPPAFGLLPGLEGPGLPEIPRQWPSLAIPIEPGVESLNAALATGIALYVWKSRSKSR